MFADNARTMTNFLHELETGGDFTKVPMRDDVRFMGPLATAASALDYRGICSDLAESVRSISLRTMVGDDDVVHVVYDVEMGLANGPLATSQTVTFVDGEFAFVEVSFDAAAISEVAS